MKIYSYKYIFSLLKKWVPYIHYINSSYFNLYLYKLKYFYFVILFLKFHTYIRINNLCDICIVDHIMKKKRFEIIYNFLSLEYNIRIIFKYLNIYANISLISLFKSADWLERELWDLYGIFFIFHFNLRRLLTDYGFEYYPMRKDFPLTGYFELFYNEENNILSYESLELMQEYRDFDFISPWYIK